MNEDVSGVEDVAWTSEGLTNIFTFWGWFLCGCVLFALRLVACWFMRHLRGHMIAQVLE